MYALRYTISGHELEHVEYERDFGVTVSSTLKFEHVPEKIKLANSMMGLIRRVSCHPSPRMFVAPYTAFVGRFLEHAQAVWSASYRSLHKKIEPVQIRATKLVDGLQNLD